MKKIILFIKEILKKNNRNDKANYYILLYSKMWFMYFPIPNNLIIKKHKNEISKIQYIFIEEKVHKED